MMTFTLTHLELETLNLQAGTVNRFFIFLFTLISISTFAQTGGKQSFDFLNVPTNARLSALGGVNVSLADRDVNFFHTNPALVGDTLNGLASVNYQFYVADIGQATFSYTHHFNKLGMLAFGVQQMNYGYIKSYDATGIETGEFKSGETAIVISKNHQVNNFRLGANFKTVFSNIAGYSASAMMVDIGGTFIHPNKNFTVGLAMRNLGVILSSYTENKVKLPFDLQLGATLKPEHMPLRFSITAYNLARKNVTYYNLQQGVDKPGTLDKLLRRFNFAAEILIHKNVELMVGYNYLVHQELKLTTGGSGAGISMGFLAKIKAMEFIFSRSGYVVGKAGYTFTISISTHKLLKRQQAL